MIRLSGILIGSMLAVAILILLIGVPQFAATETAAVRPPPLLAEPPPAAESRIDAGATPEPDAEPAPDPEPEPERQAELEIPAANAPEEAPPVALPASPELHWYAFWSPFRSEIAANGFVAQLQRVTGFDYRVVKQKPGVYEVALAYSEDADIPRMLEQISLATGLDIPES